jgi:hypothetical protein
MVGLYSLFKYIEKGPHIDSQGRIDDRVWFYIPVSKDTETNVVTYMKFPAGGSEEDVSEEEVGLSGYIWTD